MYRRTALLIALVSSCAAGPDEAPAEPLDERPPRSEPARTTPEPPRPSPPRAASPAPTPLVMPPVTAACAPPRRTAEAPRLREGVVFSRPGGAPLALDLALPASPGPHPVVLVFHGGGWSAGLREHVRDDIATLATLGYAGAAVDYRLVVGHRNTSPAAVADARCAVRYLRSHAEALEIDPTRMVAMGYSAGGQIALMLATAEDVAGLDGGCRDVSTSPRVRGAIGYFAPVDLRPEAAFSRAADRVLTRLLGRPRRRAPEAAALASPIAHVDGRDAAVLLVHGDADRVVPIEQARRMRASMARAGAPARLVELEGAPHGFRLFGPDPRIRAGTCTSLAFLRAALDPDGA